MTPSKIDTVASEAVVDYLGRPPRPRDPNALLVQFGPTLGAELIAATERLTEELWSLSPAWNAGLSLLAEMHWREDQMRQRHPELSDDAIQALGNDWSFEAK